MELETVRRGAVSESVAVNTAAHAGNAAINDTDAKTLATALAPCLLWKEGPPMPSEDSGTLRPQTEPLGPEEEAVFVRLLTYMITNFKMIQG